MRSIRRFESGKRHPTDHWGHDAGPTTRVVAWIIVVVVLALLLLALNHFTGVGIDAIIGGL